jgi:hypothetical protein
MPWLWIVVRDSKRTWWWSLWGMNRSMDCGRQKRKLKEGRIKNWRRKGVFWVRRFKYERKVDKKEDKGREKHEIFNGLRRFGKFLIDFVWISRIPDLRGVGRINEKWKVSQKKDVQYTGINWQ